MNKEGGFTLIELVVSFTIFISLISLTTLTFAQTLQTRRVISDLNASMNSIAFVTEQMVREIRTGTDFKNFAGEETIRFTNANDEKVSYKKINGGIGRCVGGSCNVDLVYKALTSPDVKIDKLKFILRGTERGDGFAPRITIITGVAGPKGINVPLQTTISARVIEEDS
ncbi:MAG: type II secretion system protein [Candidatus Colwellbacteria bacterium]|nr:type II secretion system protein [Candidatus Colwellbacteria bacterium]